MPGIGDLISGSGNTLKQIAQLMAQQGRVNPNPGAAPPSGPQQASGGQTAPAAPPGPPSQPTAVHRPCIAA
jgi:hypothetical protein